MSQEITKTYDLQNEWTLWIDVNSSQQEYDFPKYLMSLGSFSTIHEFWRFFNKMPEILLKIPSFSNIRLNKSAIRPLSEDDANRNGGQLIIPAPIQSDKLKQLWLETAMIVIGEVFDLHDKICGIVLYQREDHNSIAIWHSELFKDEILYLAKQFKKYVGLPDDLIFQHKLHESNNYDLVSTKNEPSSKFEISYERKKSNEMLKQYDRDFLLQFAFHQESMRIPKDLANVDWDLIHKEAKNYEKIRNRRGSWPPESYGKQSAGTHSLDISRNNNRIKESITENEKENLPDFQKSFENVNISLPHDSTLEKSATFDFFPSHSSNHNQSQFNSNYNFEMKKTTLEDIPLFSNQNYTMPSQILSQVQYTLASYSEYYFINLVEKYDPIITKLLSTERCPKCLRGVESFDGPFVVLRCILLDCQHVIHLNCVLNISNDLPTLHRYHCTNYFRTIPLPEAENVIPRDQPDNHRSCIIELEISHLLSNAQVLHLNWPYSISGLSDHSGKQYLLCTLDPNRHNVFFRIQRARAIFKCIDRTLLHTWQHDANFDISKAGSSNIKLVLVDSVSRNTLMIGVQRHVQDDSLFFISYIKYEFGNNVPEISPSSPHLSSIPSSTVSPPPALSGSSESPYFYPSYTNSNNSYYSNILPQNTMPFMAPNLLLDNSSQSTTYDRNYLPDNYIPDNYLSPNQNILQPTIIDHVVGRVFLLSKSQGGSRFVQQKLDEDDPMFFNIFFNELKTQISDLMIDNFGHYALEKLVMKCSEEQCEELLSNLLPNIVEVACHKQGSFSIQSMMDHLSTPRQIMLLTEGLQQDLTKIITNSSGHFVILRFLARFPFNHSQFILECIQKNCLLIATDHHGLRVIKAILDTGSSLDIQIIYKAIARLALKLAENQYGNYCIQHVLYNAPPNICNSIFAKMEGKYVRLSKQKFSSNVVEKCLRQASPEWRARIIFELTSEADELIRDKFGNYVLQKVVPLCNSQQLQDFLKIVDPALNNLRDNVRVKWGKILKDATSQMITN